ncbi:MAG: hypothetical protein IJX63_10925 [Lachnospiraceae bacterium]|nr:hypothetical protein [Lachnospiraceae bacterium]
MSMLACFSTHISYWMRSSCSAFGESRDIEQLLLRGVKEKKIGKGESRDIEQLLLRGAKEEGQGRKVVIVWGIRMMSGWIKVI